MYQALPVYTCSLPEEPGNEAIIVFIFYTGLKARRLTIVS